MKLTLLILQLTNKLVRGLQIEEDKGCSKTLPPKKWNPPLYPFCLKELDLSTCVPRQGRCFNPLLSGNGDR